MSHPSHTFDPLSYLATWTGSRRRLLHFSDRRSWVVIRYRRAYQIGAPVQLFRMSFLQISAFNTRMVKDTNMFVRTHVVYYFLCLLLSDVLQGTFPSFD